jgi:hypothetical protein
MEAHVEKKQMLGRNYRAVTAITALAVSASLWGCVADRPSRNGVFNENQYLRKDFLIAPGDGSVPDRGWYVKTTILSTDTPNPLANVNGAGLFAGAEGQAVNLVRFAVTQDKLQVLNMRELTNDPTILSQAQRIPEVVNAWPVTNVDLKYQINLDGEKTNFYQENQELDWQVRQWVKLNFAKNDLSDLYAFGANTNPTIQKCADLLNASETLVDGTFQVDEANESFQFVLNMTIPIAFDETVTTAADGTQSSDAATCMAAFGAAGTTFFQMGRQNVSLNMLTSFVRPEKIVSPTYVPMPIAEKDPIQHKYGAFQTVPLFRDPVTGLLNAQQLVTRFDPNKANITYYFSPGMPAVYQQFFLGTDLTGKTTGLQFQTNQIMAKSGALGRLQFLNYNDAAVYKDAAGPTRQVGDPRYSWINWHTDLDNSSGLLGIAQFFANPLTGETMSATVNCFEGNFKDSVQQRLELFLQTVGAEYLLPDGSDFDNTKYGDGSGNCTTGQQMPLVPADITARLNSQSTVYNKMQAQLQKPFADFGYLSPADFIPNHVDTTGAPDAEFWNAFYAVIPYQTYADPQGNMFVNPEGSIFTSMQAQHWAALQNQASFEQWAGAIDNGSLTPFDTESATNVQDAVAFANTWTTKGEAVTDSQYTSSYLPMMKAADDIGLFSYFDIYQKDGRHCVDGKWETLASYTNNLITSLNEAVVTHEFGHTLGLRHNFMGSVDQRNFPTQTDPINPAKQDITLYSSSIMDYSQQIVEAFFESPGNTVVWGNYDAAALAWIYGNNLKPTTTVPLQTAGPAAGTGASGQVSSTSPWNDPLGFQADGKTEIPFLYCSDEHTKYTPLCRRYDTGSTPAEIMANDIQRREWNYLFTNFRLYHKFFSEENYPTSVVNDFNEMRRFASLWNFDWSDGELINTLRLIGTPVPAGATVNEYYDELTNKFEQDISVSNQLSLSYQRAVLDQSSGERPYVTQFDAFYGDVTQQGIQLDKLQVTASAMENWAAISNYDPTQANGQYLTSIAGGIGDPAYSDVATAALADYLGAAFATFSYAQVGPIAAFAANSHSQKFSGNLTYRDWVGGQAFGRERDFLDYVHAIAVAYHFQNCDQNGTSCAPCTSLDVCTWDPRTLAGNPIDITQSDTYNRFQGPDGRTYIWGYISSRNEWVLVDRDRNVAAYTQMLNWTADVVNGQDDGYNGASPLEKNVRFVIDAFTYYNDQTLTAP